MIEEDLNQDKTFVTDGPDESDDESKIESPPAPKEKQIYEETYDVPKVFWDVEAVEDWGARIEAYTDAQKQFYLDHVPKIQEMKGVAKSTNGWDLLVDNKSEQVKIETKKSIRGLMMLRAAGPIDWSPMEVYRCMQYKQMRPEWDLNNE